MNRERIISEFGLRRFGSKGWLGNSPYFTCPVCGRYDKIGVIFTSKGAVVNCFHENHYTKPLRQYLIEVNRRDLIEESVAPISANRRIEGFLDDEEEREVKDLPEKRLPIGFKEITSHPYLEDRGFLDYHYQLFRPGVTKLDIRQLNNLIFQIFDRRGVRVGWVSRSLNSKEWHKENLARSKEGLCDLKLRYDNSPNTDFSRMLGGVQEVTDSTKSIILVEGLFDKTNVDIQLRLYESEEVKCLFTFGDSITQEQVALLGEFGRLESIYLVYDYNTIEQSKQSALMIESALYKKVLVGEITEEGKDPGNMSRDELLDVLSKSVETLSFKIGKLNYV